MWQTLVHNKTWVVPTLVAMRTVAQQREAAKRPQPCLAYLPPALRKSWAPDEIDKQISPEVAHWYLAQFRNDMKLARSMHAAGVQMMAGSDSLDPFNFPGPSLHEELKLLTEAGFTPLQALQAATSKPAEFLNATGEGGWGTIERERLPTWSCSTRIRLPTSPTPEKSPPLFSAANFSRGTISIRCSQRHAPLPVR